MKESIHPKDVGLALQRKIGKRKGAASAWKLEAVARLAPKELRDIKEDPIHDIMLAKVKAAGFPHMSYKEALYHWLIIMADKHWQARALLDNLSDFPDLTMFAPDPSRNFVRMLSLEIKRPIGGQASKGQKWFSEQTGGVIAHGLEQATAAFERFMGAL